MENLPIEAAAQKLALQLQARYSIITLSVFRYCEWKKLPLKFPCIYKTRNRKKMNDFLTNKTFP